MGAYELNEAKDGASVAGALAQCESCSTRLPLADPDRDLLYCLMNAIRQQLRIIIV
jgi:hypothetical protein